MQDFTFQSRSHPENDGNTEDSGPFPLDISTGSIMQGQNSFTEDILKQDQMKTDRNIILTLFTSKKNFWENDK